MTSLVGEDLKKYLGPVVYKEIDLDFGLPKIPESEHAHRLAPSDRTMRMLMDNGTIMIQPFLEDDQIQPGSIDLRAGLKVREMDGTASQLNLDTLEKHTVKMTELEFGEKMVLYPGHPYLIESYEAIFLPANIEGETDTRSTVGRVGVSCLALGKKFAHIPSTHPIIGPIKIWSATEPYVYRIEMIAGQTRFLQVKFRYKGTSYMTPDEIKQNYGTEFRITRDRDGKNEIPLSDILEEDGLKLTLNTQKAFAQRKNVKKPLDMTRKGYYDPGEFWEVVEADENGEIMMDKRRLYLLGSNETVVFNDACGQLSRADIYAGFGNYLNFAGLINPYYFGQITHEFWSENKRVLGQGQHSGRVRIEDLTAPVTMRYGAKSLGSSYSGQLAPTLPKIFRHSSEFE